MKHKSTSFFIFQGVIVLIFSVMRDHAVATRGSSAFGGEFFILLIPVMYYVAHNTIKSILEIFRGI